MRRVTAVALACAFVSFGPAAGAQSFGSKGDVSFAAERLMGFYIYDEGGASSTTFGLGFDPGFAFRGNMYETARLGVDFFVIDHLSIGGGLGYVHWSFDRGRGGSNDASGFLFSPRVGYAIEFSDSFGFWPRGGFTFRNADGDDEMALTLEGMFYGAPSPHFAFIFGPAFDIGMVGDGSEGRSFGLLTAGILGWI